MLDMPDAPISLSEDQRNNLLRRYLRQPPPSELTYGIVSDFCDSSDHISFLSQLQGDLKDLQRPAALKIILRILQPGSSLLEVGAGEPVVANILSELGYNVTVIDPYDGSGNGPIEFECYLNKYSNLRFIRDRLSSDLAELEPATFDCVFSISVLEHVHQPALSELFRGLRKFLRPDGYSLHLIDHVLAGAGAEFHLRQVAEILALQSELASEPRAQVTIDLVSTLEKLAHDNETYYLSAGAHNRWRGALPYETFPFRKVVSIHSLKQYTSR